MWQPGEIVQGDSGQVVSNKLDSEFARIQTWQGNVDTTLSTFTYTDDTTIFNKSINNQIVSPYTYWLALNPELVKVEASKLITDHIENKLFDSIFWLRSDVMFEYSGAYRPLASIGDGYMVTKAHLAEFNTGLEDLFIMQDGSKQMATGYEPSTALDVATKKYVDALATQYDDRLDSHYTEYPVSSLGDKTFTAPIGTKPFIIFLNGVMQRRIKFSYNEDGFTFGTPLDDGDEVTIMIVGDI